MMMPLTAMIAFFATEFVFATFGVRRWPEEVTVTTRSHAKPPVMLRPCGHEVINRT
jgi:hypothetical protein